MGVDLDMTTTTLFNVIRSELIKQGHDEFIDSSGNLVLFDPDHQFMQKILNYDEDVSDIVDHLFNGASLEKREYDQHFKKSFIFRFLNRQINRQTIEAFKVELALTFMMHQSFIHSLYRDLDKYINQSQITESNSKQVNKQDNEGTTTSDNRQAFANLPQNNVQLDVNNTVMESASDNTISRNKQTNKQKNDGETSNESKTENKTYQFDELFKSNGIMEQVLNEFDKKCFLQFW